MLLSSNKQHYVMIKGLTMTAAMKLKDDCFLEEKL